jgi:hypothetical protein
MKEREERRDVKGRTESKEREKRVRKRNKKERLIHGKTKNTGREEKREDRKDKYK